MRGDQKTAINAEIDDVARALTAQEPSVRLRTRVARRLIAARRPVWRSARAIGAAVATVLVVAALFWLPRAERTDSVSGPSMEREARVAGETSSRQETRVDERTRVGPVTASPRAAQTAARAIPRAPAVVLPETPLESTIERIVTEPLLVEPLPPHVFALDTLPVPMPLVLDELNIEPLEMR